MALYDAFISYSHLKDKPIAAALQSAIQKLGKPWYRRRALRLFRDDTSLSATPHLWPTIEQALGQSGHFLLLASPEAAASKWVNKEVAYWLEHNSIDTLLIGLTDGEFFWDDSTADFVARGDKGIPLPPALAKRFPSEPKWVDLRPYREGADRAASKRDAKFTELAADFSAAIRGMPKEDLLSQEVRQQRRALRLAVGAAAALLILAVAATGAGILAYQAEQRAKRTLAEATDTANKLVFELAQRFENSVGIPAALIKDILDRARALQEQLIKSGQVTPDLKRSEAEALMETANSRLTIGDTKGALAAAQEARQIFADLLAGNPGSADYQRELSVAYDKVGNVQVAQGQLVDALASYQESLAIRERLAKSDSGNAGWQRDLSVSYDKVGDVQVAQGKLAEALASYQATLAIMQRLAKSDPGNAGWQRDLSVSYERVGDVQVAQGKLADALASYQAEFAVLDRLAKSDPGNAGWQHDLSVSYEKVGDVQVAQGKLADALASYQASLAIRERLTKSDPGNAGWQRDLSVSYEKVGDVQVAQGKLADALASYQAEFAILDRLAKSDPGNAGWQHDLSVSYEKVGDVQVAQGELADALASYQASLAIRERLTKSDPGNAGWQRDLSVSLGDVGSVERQQGDLVSALAVYRESLDICIKLAAQNPSNKQWQDDLNYVIAKVGGMAFDLLLAHDFADALQAADQAISLAPDQIWLYTNRAHALMFLGRTDEARALYLKYRSATNVQEGKPWPTLILEDFAALRKAGLTNPLMDEIAKDFVSAG
jgi:tetratricopeptide (TPR) repeat protein